MKTEELRLRAKYLPLEFQIGQVRHPDNFHELFGAFSAMHHERGVRGSTGYQGPGGRVVDNVGPGGRAVPIIKKHRLNFSTGGLDPVQNHNHTPRVMVRKKNNHKFDTSFALILIIQPLFLLVVNRLRGWRSSMTAASGLMDGNNTN